MTTRKNAAVRIDEDVRVGDDILYAGVYVVSMPSEYDPDLITGEDIIQDGELYILLDRGFSYINSAV